MEFNATTEADEYVNTLVAYCSVKSSKQHIQWDPILKRTLRFTRLKQHPIALMEMFVNNGYWCIFSFCKSALSIFL